MTEQQVKELFAEGFDCSQVVLLSAAERLGLGREEALRLSSGFGGGMYAGETCGAVVGALMAIGCRYGHCAPNEFEKKQALTEKVCAFRAAFAAEHGSTMCRDILGHDISQPGEMEKVLEKNLLMDLCPRAVMTAIRVLDQVLPESDEKEKEI